jgi:hypothetical protein
LKSSHGKGASFNSGRVAACRLKERCLFNIVGVEFYYIVGCLGFSALINMPAEIFLVFSLFIGEVIHIYRGHAAISALYNSHNCGNLFSLPFHLLRNTRRALKIALGFLKL